jgi:hypothetical protein
VHKILIWSLIAGLLGSQALFIVLLWKADGVRVSYPLQGGRSGVALEVSGDAWIYPGAGTIDHLEVSAEPSGGASGGAVKAAGSFQVVKDRGRPIFSLPFWSARVELPSEGEWIITATAHSADGRAISSEPRRFSAAAVPPGAFVPWSPPHLVGFGLALAGIVAVAARRGGEGLVRRFALPYSAFFISHGLIMAGSLALATSGRVRVTAGSLLRTFLISNLALVPVWIVNRLLALAPPYTPGNYFFIAYPPPTGSVIDLFAEVFGPSPFYLIGFVLMGLAVFGLLWLPWAVARKAGLAK